MARGTDRRIRIRTKMSRIRNTAAGDGGCPEEKDIKYFLKVVKGSNRISNMNKGKPWTITDSLIHNRQIIKLFINNCIPILSTHRHRS
jgi:hypothetical protein